MKYLLILFIALLFSISLPINEAKAQEGESRSLMVSTVPQYLLIQGLRMDIDKKLPLDRSWLVIAPQIYLGYTNRDGEASNFGGKNWYTGSEYDQVIGAGLDVYHKIFLEDNERPVGVYYAYGLSFRTFKMNFKSEIDSTAPDLTIHRVVKDANQQIFSGGFGMIMGYQEQIKDYFLTDFYMGIGARYSNDDKGDYAYTRRYDRRMWDYAWTGTQLVIGLRFGVLLK
jgi:hypothetical protein